MPCTAGWKARRIPLPETDTQCEDGCFAKALPEIGTQHQRRSRMAMNVDQRRSGLSKTRITAFEQCPKRLWLSVIDPASSRDLPRSSPPCRPGMM